MNLITEDQVLLDIDVKSKKDLFKKLSQVAFNCDLVTSEKALYKGFLQREKESSTAMEEGFAIPHAKIMEIKKPAIIYAKIKNSISWKSFDGKKIKIILALLIPESEVNNLHIKVLSTLAKSLLKEDFRNALKSENKKENIVKIIKDMK